MKKAIIRKSVWEDDSSDSSKIEIKDLVKIIDNQLDRPENKQAKNRIKAKIKNIKEKFIITQIIGGRASIAGRGLDGEIVEVDDLPLSLFQKTSTTRQQGEMALPDEAEIERAQSDADFSKISDNQKSEFLNQITSKLEDGNELATSDYKFLLQMIFSNKATQKETLQEIEKYSKISNDKNFIDGLLRTYDKNSFSAKSSKTLVGAMIALKHEFNKPFTKRDISNIFNMPSLVNNNDISNRISKENFSDAKQVLESFQDPNKIPNQVLRKKIESGNNDDVRILESQGIEDADNVLSDKNLWMKHRDKIIDIYKKVLEIDPEYKFSKRVLDIIKSKSTQMADEIKIISYASKIPEGEVKKYIEDPGILFRTKNASPAEIQALNEIKRKLFRAYNIITRDSKFEVSNEFKQIYEKIINQHKEEVERQDQPETAQGSNEEKQTLIDLGAPEDLINQIFNDPKSLVANLNTSGKLEEAYNTLQQNIGKAIAKDPNYASNPPKPIKDFLAAYNELKKQGK